MTNQTRFYKFYKVKFNEQITENNEQFFKLGVVKIEEHKSYKYAQSVINGEIPAPKYVIKQCRDFIAICSGKSERYFIDEEKLSKIDNILKLLIMPRGLKTGENIYDCSCGYQWLIYAALCVVYRENPDKRRYETIILEVGRKNFKTFTVATIFVLLFLLEPKFSKFYSVAPDGALSREVKTAIEEILKSSPTIYYYNSLSPVLKF